MRVLLTLASTLARAMLLCILTYRTPQEEKSIAVMCVASGATGVTSGPVRPGLIVRVYWDDGRIDDVDGAHLEQITTH